MEFLNAIFIFSISILFAFLEIEIEGKNGWAKKLPTWYRKSGLSKLPYLTTSKKPLTGYHLIMNLFILLVFHSIFFFGIVWTPIREIAVITAYLIFIIIEDFLWFLFNPYFGLKNFKKEKIWWHNKSKWIFGLFPIDYLKGITLIVIITYLTSLILKVPTFFYDSMEILGLVIGLTIISMLFVSPYKRWYKKMRRLDESKLFNRKISFNE